MKKVLLLVTTVTLLSLLCFAQSSTTTQREKLDKIQQSLKDDIPRFICVDDRFATGGQPSDAAFPKLAANGYRVVLNLRTTAEGADLPREKAAVEKAGLRYISIPVDSAAPRNEQVDQFIASVKNSDNQPMFIHCASGNRVGAFWLIYRTVDQSWALDKAKQEAEQIGLTSESLKSFAKDYIDAHKPKKSG
jgi:uncharacterized protein (TIGR01244 family)